MPKKKSPLETAKEEVVGRFKEDTARWVNVGQTVNDISRNRFEIGGKELYIKEFDVNDPKKPKAGRIIVVCGEEETEIDDKKRQQVMKAMFLTEMSHLFSQIKKDSYDLVALNRYFNLYTHQQGFLNIAETVVKSHLTDSDENNIYIRNSTAPPTQFPRKLTFEVKNNKIKFTEYFELENYMRVGGISDSDDVVMDLDNIKTGHNATVKCSSTISVTRGAIDHSFGKIEIDRKNEFGYHLFPPKTFAEVIKNVSFVIKDTFLSLQTICNDSLKKFYKKHIKNSFSEISDKLEEAAFNIKQDPKKLKQELLAIESDSSWEELVNAKKSIENSYSRMGVGLASHLKDDLNAGGQSIKSALATMGKFDDEYIQKMTKKIEMLEEKFAFIDFPDDDSTLQNEMMASIEKLKENVQQIKFFKRTAPEVSKFMINLGNMQVSKSYKKLKTLKEKIENNRDNPEGIREEVDEFRELYESLNNDFRSKMDNEIDGDFLSLHQEDYFYSTEEDLNSLASIKLVAANEKWCPDLERIDQEEEKIDDFLSDVGQLVDELNEDKRYSNV